MPKLAGSVAIISRADHSFSLVGGDRMALFLGLGSFDMGWTPRLQTRQLAGL